MPRRVSSASSSLHALSSNVAGSTHSGAAASSGSSSLRGPRPAKSANCIAPASPSPDSSSDNASDNSDLFQWTTTGVEKHLARSDSGSSALSSSAAGSRLTTGHGQTASPSSASLTASRKRKLLEQFLLPENATTSGANNTISLSDMRTMGLVGQARPSASIQPTSHAGIPVAPSAVATTSTRSSVGGISFSAVSNYVPSFSFYQSRFGPPSCSGGGSTESLCSSTADSACGHPPDLPDDGNLATPAPPVDVSLDCFLFCFLMI